MVDTAPENLVDKAFWEGDYFGATKLPARPDPALPIERNIAAELERSAPLAAGQSVIEIGCAPAPWLVWYGERFGASLAGIEYSSKGAELSRRNLESVGLTGDIREGDFFSDSVLGGQFDLVLSLGFIEHFDDLEAAFERHLRFIKPGGRLAIGVPHYRGLIGRLQRWADPAHLALHNTGAMKPSFYGEMATRHGLQLRSLHYVGGPDPIMVKVSRHGPAPVILPMAWLRKVRFMDRVNSRLWSSYMLVVLESPAV